MKITNVACRINDCEFITLARTNRTPALQAKVFRKDDNVLEITLDPIRACFK